MWRVARLPRLVRTMRPPLVHRASPGRFAPFLPQLSAYGRGVSSTAAAYQTPSQAYNALVAKGALQRDAQQMKVLQPLDNLYAQLQGYDISSVSSSSSGATKGAASGSSSENGGKGWFSSMFSSSPSPPPPSVATTDASSTGVPSLAVDQPKGVYMYGGVGCGKSMLMDLFYGCCDGVVQRKRRVHFHAFMLEVHRRMHELKVAGHQGDPLPRLIDDYLKESTLLCFDEFQVTDVADALIMRRLFGGLIDRGMVMVSTSNRDPDSLYVADLQ